MALPYVGTEMMQLHLHEIASNVAPGAPAVRIFACAGWQTKSELKMPADVTLI